MKLYKILILITLLSTLFTKAAYSNVQVYPTRLVLSDKKRIGQLTLTHAAKEEMSYEILPIFYTQDASGKMKALEGDAAKKEAKSAISALRFSPRVFTLKTGQTQVVKVQVNPGAKLGDGVYRAHLKFQPSPKMGTGNESEKKASKGSAMTLTALLAVAVPVYFQHGKIEHEMSIESVQLLNEGKQISFHLKQSGNGMAFGDFFVFTKGGKNKEEQEVGRLLGMAAYSAERKVDIELESKLPQQLGQKNQLRIEFRQSPDEGGALLLSKDVQL